jgi:hypothetical protein
MSTPTPSLPDRLRRRHLPAIHRPGLPASTPTRATTSPTTGQSSQVACAAGTYQPSTGQASCLDADAGHYVAITASRPRPPAPRATYQPSTGQASCLDADAGHYVPTTGQSAQTACAAGTYQPSTGSGLRCLDADAGHYVASGPVLPDRLRRGHLPALHRPGLLPRRRRRPLRRLSGLSQPGGLRARDLPAK